MESKGQRNWFPTVSRRKSMPILAISISIHRGSLSESICQDLLQLYWSLLALLFCRLLNQCGIWERRRGDEASGDRFLHISYLWIGKQSLDSFGGRRHFGCGGNGGIWCRGTLRERGCLCEACSGNGHSYTCRRQSWTKFDNLTSPLRRGLERRAVRWVRWLSNWLEAFQEQAEGVSYRRRRKESLQIWALWAGWIIMLALIVIFWVGRIYIINWLYQCLIWVKLYIFNNLTIWK